MSDAYHWMQPTEAEQVRTALNNAHNGAGLAGIGFRILNDSVNVYVVPTGASVDSVTPIDNTLRCPGAPGCPT